MELIEHYAVEMSKDFSNVIANLEENDIVTVDDLTNLSDSDLKDLGFSLGLKNRVKKNIQERQNLREEARQDNRKKVKKQQSIKRTATLNAAQGRKDKRFVPDHALYFLIGNEDYSVRRQ